VRLLIDAGASIGAADVEGSTALHRAAHSGNVDVRASCCSSTRPTCARDRLVARHAAAQRRLRRPQGRRSLVLLDAGAAVDAADEAGNSALHLAMHQSQRDCAKVLLARGADPKLRNKKGMIPLHYAVNDHKCLKLLLDLGCERRRARRARPRAALLRRARHVRGRRAPAGAAAAPTCARSTRRASRPPTSPPRTPSAGWRALCASATTRRASSSCAASAAPCRRSTSTRSAACSGRSSRACWRATRRADIAEFLHVAEDLNKVKVGQYIADKDDKSAAVRRAFMDPHRRLPACRSPRRCAS
jgi:hypothetical protein